MAIEDTFGYRLVRISLVLLNCLVLVRLLSILLQYSHVFEPTFVLFILLIGTNFMAAIIGVIREHRVSVILTGSITLIMFLSIIFAAKENKSLNFSLLTLLAIAVQSLIFSEMLKERHAFPTRRNIGYLATMSRNRNSNNNDSPNLAAVVVYQSNRDQPSNLFMIDPTLAKDPPPSYFASNSPCPPPNYEDAIKVDASDQSLPVVAEFATSSQALEATSSSSTITLQQAKTSSNSIEEDKTSSQSTDDLSPTSSTSPDSEIATTNIATANTESKSH